VYSGETLITDDVAVDLVAGDELKRALPNREEEVFEVLERTAYDDAPSVPAHISFRIRMKGAVLREPS
jgi:hypothetical protein